MIISGISRKTDTKITSILLYDDPSFSAEVNTNIPNLSIDYILSKGLIIFSFYWDLIRILNLQNFSFPAYLFVFFVLFYLHFIFCEIFSSSRYTKFLSYLFIVIFNVLYVFFGLYLRHSAPWSSVLKPFLVNVTFLHPLKTSENLWFPDVFTGYRKETVTWNGLKLTWNRC